MEHQAVVDLIRGGLMGAFWLALPLLALGFCVGIVVSLIQVLTSVQDPAFGSVPRLAAFLLGIFVLLPWMLMRLANYTMQLFGDLQRYAR